MSVDSRIRDDSLANSPNDTLNNAVVGCSGDTPEVPKEVLTGVTPRDVVLSGRRRIALRIFTREQLVFIGKENLQYYKRCWEEMLAKAGAIVAKHDELLELLKDATAESLQEVAKQYDNPHYKSRHSGYTGEAIRPDAPDVASRAAGSTTLNICGWCKYGLAYSMPEHRVYLAEDGERLSQPCCGLLTDEWHAKYLCGEYNTPCVLTHPRADWPSVREIRIDIAKRRQKYLDCQQVALKRVEYLDAVIAEAESKPLFPNFRMLHHYDEGTPVFFFDHGGSSQKIDPYPYGWSLKECICKVGRGTVSDYTENQFVKNTVTVKKAEYLGGVRDHYEIASDDERLVSFEEFTYLVKNPDYAQIWLASCGDRGGEVATALNFYWQYGYITV